MSLPQRQPGPASAPLTRFQRMLLGTDGTVTHLLEAYAGEPIEVVKLLQEFDSSTDGDRKLQVSMSDKVLRRRVVLRSSHSKQNLLYAEAVVVLDRVDQAFLDGLLDTDKPIGKLLAENRIETFREILLVDRVPAGPCGVHFGIDAAAQVISRTYRIVAQGRPMILIAERFPPTIFRDVPV